MEWNTKWDWENLDIFSSKGAASPKKLQSAYWGIQVDGSSNLSCIEGSNISSVSSGEPFIGLKLGKRTYFENSYAKSINNRTSSILGIPVSSVSMGKKVKPSSQTTPISRCQVEGCNLDLSSSKDYHRKHRVCERHSKCPKVIVGGVERRFCQQCSRFHGMSEFDEEKRSCRRRLSDHNARRRKPQQELNQFNSSIPYSSFYDPPLVQTRPARSSTWESTCNSKCSTGVQFSDALNRSVPPKGVFDLGFKEPLSSNVDAVDLHHALSLLSNNNNSWGSSDILLDHHHHHHHHHRMQHSMPQDAVPPLSSQDYYWQQSIHAKTSNHFQECQIFRSSYENSFPFHPNG